MSNKYYDDCRYCDAAWDEPHKPGCELEALNKTAGTSKGVNDLPPAVIRARAERETH